MNNGKYCVRCFVLQLCITLLCRIDDIQDNSALRRGIPAAHTVYGVGSTISAAICMYFKSLHLVLRFNHPDCIKFYTEMLWELWRGKPIEIYWLVNYLGMCGVYQSVWCLWTYSLTFGIPNVLNCSGFHCVCILEKVLNCFHFHKFLSILNTKYQYINS